MMDLFSVLFTTRPSLIVKLDSQVAGVVSVFIGEVIRS